MTHKESLEQLARLLDGVRKKKPRVYLKAERRLEAIISFVRKHS